MVFNSIPEPKDEEEPWWTRRAGERRRPGVNDGDDDYRVGQIICACAHFTNHQEQIANPTLYVNTEHERQPDTRAAAAGG